MTDAGAERRRSKRLIARDGYSSLMSDTKWRKLFAALNTLKVSVKFLDVDKPISIAREGIGLHAPRAFIDTLELGPIDLVSIEWLEISQSAYDRLPDIGKLVIENQLGSVRIIGHRR